VKFIFNVTCVSSSTEGSFELSAVRLYTPGDVDGDGEVTYADVTMLIDLYASGASYDLQACDLNGDKKLTVADITLLIAKYLAQ